MRSFRHSIPEQRIYQGPDCLDTLDFELERAGSQRAVIFCGATLARPGSPLELVRQALGRRLAGIYSGAKPDTPLPEVEQAARELERLRADAIVAVGGGSAITTARAANILHAEKAPARDLCTRREPSGDLTSRGCARANCLSSRSRPRQRPRP